MYFILFILFILFLIRNKMVYLCQNMTYRKRREVFDDALPIGGNLFLRGMSIPEIGLQDMIVTLIYE